MKRCASCIWLDYYPPQHKYVHPEDGKHKCFLYGGSKVDISKDTTEELGCKNLQHVCSYRKTDLSVQLEIPF